MLIVTQDQDSWKGTTGTADSSAQVIFMPGGSPITCRRSRLQCRGCHACSNVDPKLLDVKRRDLDPASRDRIFAAQRKTRQEEGNTIEKRAVVYVH